MFDENRLNEFYHTAEKMSQNEAIMKLKEESAFYRKKAKERDGLFDVIEQALPEKKRRFIYEFEEADCECDNLECDYTYRQGFQDCLALLRWMGLFEE